MANQNLHDKNFIILLKKPNHYIGFFFLLQSHLFMIYLEYSILLES